MMFCEKENSFSVEILRLVISKTCFWNSNIFSFIFLFFFDISIDFVSFLFDIPAIFVNIPGSFDDIPAVFVDIPAVFVEFRLFLLIFLLFFERWDWRKGKVIKEWETGKILETND